MDRQILPISRLDLSLRQQPWSFADENHTKIKQHWSGLTKASPDIWNGSVLMAHDVSLSGGVFSASFLKTDYASFIAWRDWGWPDTGIYNCFGSAVVQSSDGALIYGQMRHNTLNAGLCYPPGGSLDLSDLRTDGSIDMEGSITRELAEETGLDAGKAESGDLWAVFDEQRISIARLLVFNDKAEKIVDKIAAHIAADRNPELSAAIVLRASRDLTRPMPGYARHLARHLLAD